MKSFMRPRGSFTDNTIQRVYILPLTTPMGQATGTKEKDKGTTEVVSDLADNSFEEAVLDDFYDSGAALEKMWHRITLRNVRYSTQPAYPIDTDINVSLLPDGSLYYIRDAAAHSAKDLLHQRWIS